MKKNLALIYSICLMLVSFSITAQVGDGDGGEPPPNDPLPIDDYLPLLIIAGMCLASFVIYKRIKISRDTF